jgi:putative hydrolase of the HAD superfamily
MPLTHAADFAHVETWIFDLDNTLYPAECNLFAEVDQRMAEFISRLLDVPFEEARYLQRHYYRQHGTTLTGLMKVHGLDPRPFLDYVHDVDLTPVKPCAELGAALERLPGRKLIFTNGTREYAERVAGKLGVLQHFEAIFDIIDSDYVPKPKAEPYSVFLRQHGIAPRTAAFFEDMPHNLAEPHALGMRTVLVHSVYYDHPIQHDIARWERLPEHIHHMTDDLKSFLVGAVETKAGAGGDGEASA